MRAVHAQADSSLSPLLPCLAYVPARGMQTKGAEGCKNLTHALCLHILAGKPSHCALRFGSDNITPRTTYVRTYDYVYTIVTSAHNRGRVRTGSQSNPCILRVSRPVRFVVVGTFH